jgi:hypothetical protein
MSPFVNEHRQGQEIDRAQHEGEEEDDQAAGYELRV